MFHLTNTGKLRQIAIILSFGILVIGCKIGATTKNSDIRTNISEIVAGIAKDNCLNTEYVGFVGHRTPQWDRFEKLSTEATDEELIKLTNNYNSVVKCYAFWALAKRKNANAFAIFVKHINDTESVTTFRDCIKSSERTGDFFLSLVTPGQIDLSTFKIDSTQKEKLDSILVYDQSVKIGAKSRLMSTITPKSTYYDRIKEIAVCEHNPYAFEALAKYKKNADLGLLQSLFNSENTEINGIECAINFNDSSFYLFLVGVFGKEFYNDHINCHKLNRLFQDLALYPSNNTYVLFDRALQTKNKDQYWYFAMYLQEAIDKYPNEIFAPLRQRIKLDETQQMEINAESSLHYK